MKLIGLLFLTVLFFSCHEKPSDPAITDRTDYDRFLVAEKPNATSKYFDLWNEKIRPDSMQLTSFGVVAGEYNRFFKLTGDVTYLKRAEKALTKAVEIAALNQSDYYRALARNYIAQHRFQDALKLADTARAVGGGVQASQRLLFDVHMELGNYAKAKQYLDSTKNHSDFGYLIRVAKWNDHQGDLDTTIRFMEKAMTRAEEAKNRELMLWSYTNLADYYGHAGRIDDSYRYYLKSLAIDPSNAYAKKGIAWIVFSHERNPDEAMRILDSVTRYYKAPDFYLMKAEIAEFMGDDMKTLSNLDAYFTDMGNPAYGQMYNAHNIALFVNRTKQFEKALQLATAEVQNRPTPESYSLLAQSYLNLGEIEKARYIVETYVEGRSFEPEVLFRAAEVYKANGMDEKVRGIKRELEEATFELGPLREGEIAQL